MERLSSRLHRSLGRRSWRLAVFAGALGLNLGLLGGLGMRDVQGPGAGAETAAPYVIFADIAPRPIARRVDAVPDSRADEVINSPDDEEEPQRAGALPGFAAPGAQPAASADLSGDVWRVRPPTVDDRIAHALQAGAVGCANRSLLSTSERERCDQRFQANSPHISGTGDRDRDARFARQDARELAAHEARRAAPAARTPCEQGGPISDCGVEINVEIFSTIDGFLPNLRRDD